MVSCGNSYKAQEVTLNNEADSINYAVGLLNGLQVKMYYMANDSSDEAVAEFVDALENAYMDKDEKLSDIAQAGRQLGASVKGFEKNGLADNAAWTLNEKLYFQGMVNALHGDTTIMTEEVAQEFFMQAYQAQAEGTAGDPIKAKCPKAVQKVALNNYNDSLNYAFGVLNGAQIKTYLLAEDEDGSYIGRSRYDAPEIDNSVIFTSARDLEPGDIVNVYIDDAFDYDLAGHETEV